MTSAEMHKKAHEHFNARDWDGLREIVADGMNYKDHPRALNVQSGDEFIEWVKGWPATFSDAEPADPQYIDGGDWSIALFQAKGTNDGPLGEMPATGKNMDMPFCEVMHWSNGKADRGEIYYDQMTMMTQLGVMQAPQPA